MILLDFWSLFLSRTFVQPPRRYKIRITSTLDRYDTVEAQIEYELGIQPVLRKSHAELFDIFGYNMSCVLWLNLIDYNFDTSALLLFLTKKKSILIKNCVAYLPYPHVPHPQTQKNLLLIFFILFFHSYRSQVDAWLQLEMHDRLNNFYKIRWNFWYILILFYY